MTQHVLDRRQFVRAGAITGAGALLFGCRPSEPCPAPPAAEPRKVVTLTKEWQTALTPQEIVDLAKAGNKRFVSDERQDRDYLHDVNITAGGQHPAAVILSCIDSRAPAEIILDAGIGDMFNARIAGNFVDRDLAGSMEFACAVAGAKVVMVMGHTACGAIKGAIDGAKLGNLTADAGETYPRRGRGEELQGRAQGEESRLRECRRHREREAHARRDPEDQPGARGPRERQEDHDGRLDVPH